MNGIEEAERKGGRERKKYARPWTTLRNVKTKNSILKFRSY